VPHRLVTLFCRCLTAVAPLLLAAAPAAAAVRSVQSGTQSLSGSQTATVTIPTAVNPSRAFVICDARVPGDRPGLMPTCELTSSTTVLITYYDTASTINVRWQVVEFANGVAVQRGLQTLAAGVGSANVAISSVDTARSFVLVTSRANLIGGVWDGPGDELRTVRARLTSATNLELSRNASAGAAVDVAWQVVQMDEATVQSNLTTIGAGSTSATATLPVAVNPNATFLVFNARAASGAAGNEGDWMARGTLTDATTLTFRRQGSGTNLEISWFAVSMGDGSVAYHHWTSPAPRYVLLLGDASYDPKGFFSGSSRKDILPTPFVRSSFLWTASDPLYAAVNGDDLIPDLALGRLSAGSLAEAAAAVQKILDFENAGRTLDGRAVLVADNPDRAGDFEANARDIASLLGSRPVETIFLTRLGASTHSAVRNAFDSGASLMSYIGHGSQVLWANWNERIFRAPDVDLLQPQPRQPFVLTMTCSNGYFVSPWTDALSERLTLAPDKGAIAAFSPSGLSLDHPAHLYHRALVQQLEARTHDRIGDLVLAAQRQYLDSGAFPELLGIYHLFGDPALRIR
jgi:hypothetical protein